MEKYSFKCTPKEFDLERIARENAKDGNLAFLVIKRGEVIVGIREGVKGFLPLNSPMDFSCNGYSIYSFDKQRTDLLIRNIEKTVEVYKKNQKQTYKVLTWK